MKKMLIISIILFIAILIPTKLINKDDYHSEPFEALESQNEPEICSPQGVLHRITCYLWTGNKMANGKYPKKGYVATSDRTIPFGTEVVIDGETYIVGDRTNARFQYFDIPTIDIYWEGDLESCLLFGVQYKEVIIK